MTPAVLISSSGRCVELWRLFERAVLEAGLDWRVIGADASESCATALVTGAVHVVPRINLPEHPRAISDLIEREHVALIVPTIDTELDFYAGFHKPNVLVAISSPDAVVIGRDKLALTRWALAQGFPVPHCAPIADADLSTSDSWVVKPRFGSSSVGVQLGLTSGSVDALRRNDHTMAREDLIAQHQLHGPEFTVNCFVSRSGHCAYAVPHLRMATRSGEVSHGLTVRDESIEDLARRVVCALPGSYGPSCVQVIRDRDRGPVLIEINTRFGGGYPVAERAGARGPLRLVREAAGLSELAQEDAWDAGVEMVRFDQSVFRIRSATNV